MSEKYTIFCLETLKGKDYVKSSCPWEENINIHLKILAEINSFGVGQSSMMGSRKKHNEPPALISGREFQFLD
jgi:hypothetical protein